MFGVSRYFSQLLRPTTAVDAAVVPEDKDAGTDAGANADADTDADADADEDEGIIDVENKVLNTLVAELKGIHDSEAKRNISVVGQSR